MWPSCGILAAFKAGVNIAYDGAYSGFVDKNNLPPRAFTPENKVRMVPGGSSVRRGAYVAPGVIIMPPAYVNTGAYVDEGSMIDSHALVGSCAQVGKNVHLSAGVQIGGVLEPLQASPTILEDHADAWLLQIECLELVESETLKQALIERLQQLRATSASRNELIGRALVQLERRADLLNVSLIHDDDAIAHRHRFHLVVRHV